MNKTELKAKELNSQLESIGKLRDLIQEQNPTEFNKSVMHYGTRYIYEELKKIEKKAYALMLRYCNGYTSIQSVDRMTEKYIKEIETLFGGKIEGLKINRDPRGYILKIESDVQRKLRDNGINLQSDWGGFGLLAPKI